jgi:hypothetical protein
MSGLSAHFKLFWGIDGCSVLWISSHLIFSGSRFLPINSVADSCSIGSSSAARFWTQNSLYFSLFLLFLFFPLSKCGERPAPTKLFLFSIRRGPWLTGNLFWSQLPLVFAVCVCCRRLILFGTSLSRWFTAGLVGARVGVVDLGSWNLRFLGGSSWYCLCKCRRSWCNYSYFPNQPSSSYVSTVT